MRLRLLLVLLLAAGAAFAAKPPAAPPAPSFGEIVEVNVVNVDVYAVDKNGNRVMDLKQSDFQVFEDGKPVGISNFAVVEKGRSHTEETPAAPQPSPSPAASSPEDAWNLVVFFDNFNIKPNNRTRALQQVREFLAREMAPGDRVMLVTQDLKLKVRLPFTGDARAIAQALTEIENLAVHGVENEGSRRHAFQEMMTIQEIALSDPDLPPCPRHIAQPAHNYAAARRQEVQRAVAGLTLVTNSLSGVPGRKAVLHVSDGLPLIPGDELFQFLAELCGGSGTAGIGSTGGPTSAGAGPRMPADVNQVFDARQLGPLAYNAADEAPLDAQSYNVAKELQTLAAHANAHRVTMYTLQASGLQGPDASEASQGPADRMFQFPSIGAVLRASHRDSLQLLADETGGRSILDTNNFLPDLSRMRQDFESYYSLGYAPAHTGDGRQHRIEVKVKRPGVQLRYRQSYRDKPMLEKAVDRVLAALLYGVEDNPLQITVEMGEQTAGPAGSVNVPIHLKIPLFKLAILNRETLFEGSLRLLVATGDDEGRSSPIRQIPVPLQIPRKEVLTAMGKFYIYTLTLQLKPGEQRIAVAVRDDLGATTSYLSRAVTVGIQAASTTPR
jgi:VWFA-related protein